MMSCASDSARADAASAARVLHPPDPEEDAMPEFEEPELDRDDLTRLISADERTSDPRPPYLGIALALVLIASIA